MRNSLVLGIILVMAILSTSLSPQTEVLLDQSPELVEIERLIKLADSLRSATKIDSAIAVAKMALNKIETEEDWADSLRVQVLLRLGRFHSYAGLYSEMIPYYMRCMAVPEAERWLGQSQIPDILRRIGVGHRCLGHYGEAESYVKQALQTATEAPDPDHHVIASCLHELALLHVSQLEYAEAELKYKEALDVLSLVDDADVNKIGFTAARIRGRLGDLRLDQGRLPEAESLYMEALAIAMETLGPGNQGLSEFLDNLGNALKAEGRYAEADSYYSEALRVREKVLGGMHPWLIYHLLNLADLCIYRGSYGQADSLCRRSLKILKEAGYGLHHPQAACAKRILGDSFKGRGRYDQAEQSYRDAADTYKSIYGPHHPDVAKALKSLAILYGHTGDYSKGLEVYRELLESRQSLIEAVFPRASEAQKIRFANMFSLIDHPLFSLAFADPSQQSNSLALEMTLKGKAIVIDAVSKEKEIAYCLLDTNMIKAEALLDTVLTEISSISLACDNLGLIPRKYLDSLTILHRMTDSLQTELSACSEFREWLEERRFAVSDIADLLPNDAVLWEFVRYRPWDFEKLSFDPEAAGAPRYLALMLDKEGEVTLTDLGDAGKIDSLVGLARDHIYQEGKRARSHIAASLEEELRTVTAHLYTVIFAPLESQLGSKKDIYISPDGQINLLPFEILPCPDGKYVIEKYKISYLSSGRDLLKFKSKPALIGKAVVFADPDFDNSGEPISSNGSPLSNYGPASLFIPEPSRASSGCLMVPFDRLNETQEEARSICSALKKKAQLQVDFYMGTDATEEMLKGITSPPRVLHLATHGFFCPDLGENRLLGHPLLRCGLAFAGANFMIGDNRKANTQAEDGILTALEASALNLVGTELVTLSACETGVGEVRNGEGVYGLRRAFQHAGARTIVMSLWKIRDEETCELMANFYEAWSAGKTKKEALREAALKVMNDCRAKYGNKHPYFWGGFVLLGDPN